MSLKDYIAECGCVIEMNISHDWDSGVTDAEDISIITPCKKHAVKEVSEAESQIEEDLHNDNNRIGDSLSRFTRG